MTDFKVGDKVRATGLMWSSYFERFGEVVELNEGRADEPRVMFEDVEEGPWDAWGEYAVELVRAANVAQGEANEVSDAINPSHYQGFSNGAQVVDITENLNFNRGNAVKYLARAGAKDPAKEVEDLEKSLWYTQRELDRLKGLRDA